jgi:hypothetical protein
VGESCETACDDVMPAKKLMFAFLFLVIVLMFIFFNEFGVISVKRNVFPFSVVASCSVLEMILVYFICTTKVIESMKLRLHKYQLFKRFRPRRVSPASFA